MYTKIQLRRGQIAQREMIDEKAEQADKLLTEVRNDLLCIEPEKRMVAGKWDWAVHRFPIRGGISRNQIIRKAFAELLYTTSTRPGFMRRFLAQGK